MNLDIARITYAIAVHGYDFITRGLNAGKQSRESQEAIFEEELEAERKSVVQIYDAQGKIVKYQQSENPINIIIGNYYRKRKQKNQAIIFSLQNPAN